MLITERRHKYQLEKLNSVLEDNEREIIELSRQLASVERSRHEFVELTRYVIESGAMALGDTGDDRASDLSKLGHVLPYVLSGKRSWDGPVMQPQSRSPRDRADELAKKYHFTLPGDPIEATKALLMLAMVLFTPGASVPLHTLQRRFPIEQGGGDFGQTA